MIISDIFKESLMLFDEACLKKIWLEKVLELPNDQIAWKFRDVLSNRNYRVMMFWVAYWERRSYDIWDITWIDNEYIWTTRDDMYSWREVLDALKVKLMENTHKFKEWEIIQWISADKIRRITSHDRVRRIVAWRYFECVWYGRPERRVWRWRKYDVFVKDIYGVVLGIWQELFQNTKYKNLKRAEGPRLKSLIKERIKDNQKRNVDRLTLRYSQTLREFMNISKSLSEASTDDIDKLVKNEMDTTIDLTKILERDIRVEKAVCHYWDMLEITTNCLFSEDNRDLPIGKYKVSIKMNVQEFEIKITNLCVEWSNYQHPHIGTRWNPCLGAYSAMLNKLYKESDYIALCFCVIDYLHSHYGDSVHINRDIFIDKRKHKFTAELEKEEKREKKRIALAKKKAATKKKAKKVIKKKVVKKKATSVETIPARDGRPDLEIEYKLVGADVDLGAVGTSVTTQDIRNAVEVIRGADLQRDLASAAVVAGTNNQNDVRETIDRINRARAEQNAAEEEAALTRVAERLWIS